MATSPPDWLSEDRGSVKFIRCFQLLREGNRWGFVVYPTVYTPGSEARWEEAIEKLRALMVIAFKCEQHDDPSLFMTV